MRITDQPWKTPARCIVVPHITQQTQGITWVDTNAEIPGGPRDNHVYVSDVGVRQMMATLGYPSPAEYDELAQQLAAAEAALIEATEKNTRYEAALAAIGTLEQAGILTEKKQKVAA